MASRNSIWFYTLAISALVLDQITKFAARAMLTLGHKVTVIPGFFDLELSYNSGGAFGMLPNWTPLFIIVALVAIYAIVRLRRAGPDSRSLAIGLGLLLGGALGNLVDRLISPHREVTDFLSFHIGTRSWPTFNVADIAIVVGALFTLFYVYVIEKRRVRGSEL